MYLLEQKVCQLLIYSFRYEFMAEIHYEITSIFKVCKGLTILAKQIKILLEDV